MKFVIPRSMKEEHEELHQKLARAEAAPDPVGSAARAVKELVRSHAFKEERYALRPLGLLPSLAKGEVTPEMADVVPMTEQLRRELPIMLAEHGAIVAALKNLIAVATTAGKPEYAQIAQKLMQHIQVEEEIAYPAAILVGEFVKLKLDPSAPLRQRDTEREAIPDIG